MLKGSSQRFAVNTGKMLLVFVLAGILQADNSTRPASFLNAVGSWFGRAVADQVVCQPGTPNCPVPPEIVMVYTIAADGTFIGIDSNIFSGGSHSTAHGEWTATGLRKMRATFTLIQSSPAGVFIGGFKNLFEATLTEPDKMEGKITAYLYFYTDANGKALVDAEGLPTPSPLSPPEQCAPPGCLSLGTFKFKARRVAVQK